MILNFRCYPKPKDAANLSREFRNLFPDAPRGGQAPRSAGPPRSLSRPIGMEGTAYSWTHWKRILKRIPEEQWILSTACPRHNRKSEKS
jgi:hypothetical protein